MCRILVIREQEMAEAFHLERLLKKKKKIKIEKCGTRLEPRGS